MDYFNLLKIDNIDLINKNYLNRRIIELNNREYIEKQRSIRLLMRFFIVLLMLSFPLVLFLGNIISLTTFFFIFMLAMTGYLA